MQVETGLSRKARIEMIPLMDIVFLLLVFFIYAMVSMVVGKQGIEVNLSSQSTAKPSEEQWSIVTVRASGDYLFNDKEMTLNEIVERTKTYVVEHPKWGLYLNADQATTWGRSVDLINAVGKGGCSKVTILTKPANAGAKQ